jgi:hypothetical protein
MGEVLKLQEQTKDKRVDGQLLTPRLPQMHGHRATTSVWPEVHLRGADAPTQTLMPWRFRGLRARRASVTAAALAGPAHPSIQTQIRLSVEL